MGWWTTFRIDGLQRAPVRVADARDEDRSPVSPGVMATDAYIRGVLDPELGQTSLFFCLAQLPWVLGGLPWETTRRGCINIAVPLWGPVCIRWEN